MSLESPQPFQKSSLGSTIVPLTLREKVLCAGVIAIPKGHILIGLLNLRGRWLASAQQPQYIVPLIMADNLRAPSQRRTPV